MQQQTSKNGSWKVIESAFWKARRRRVLRKCLAVASFGGMKSFEKIPERGF